MDVGFIKHKGFLWGIDLSEEQAQQFNTYYNLIQQENKKYNLTRIEKEEDILDEHFFDPLKGYLKGRDMTCSELLDVGSGAGFPGIPLKIFIPELRVILVEKTRKKALFLKKVVRELGLSRVEIWQNRAEQIARSSGRETFCWVTARAVAPLPLILEIALPLLQKGGFFWSLQGPSYAESLAAAKSISSECGARLEEVVQYSLPVTLKKRVILIFKKTGESNSLYPRYKS